MPNYDIQLIKDLNNDTDGSANDVAYEASGMIADTFFQSLLYTIPNITFPYNTDDQNEINLVSYLALALFRAGNNADDMQVKIAKEAIQNWFAAKYLRPSIGNTRGNSLL